MSPILLNFRKSMKIVSLLPKECRDIQDLPLFLEILFSNLSPENFLGLCNVLEVEIKEETPSIHYIQSIGFTLGKMDIKSMVSTYVKIGFE